MTRTFGDWNHSIQMTCMLGMIQSPTIHETGLFRDHLGGWKGQCSYTPLQINMEPQHHWVGIRKRVLQKVPLEVPCESFPAVLLQSHGWSGSLTRSDCHLPTRSAAQSRLDLQRRQILLRCSRSWMESRNTLRIGWFLWIQTVIYGKASVTHCTCPSHPFHGFIPFHVYRLPGMSINMLLKLYQNCCF